LRQLCYYYINKNQICSRLKPIDNPFKNNISCSCEGLLHQQFSLSETFRNLESAPLTIYRATPFEVTSSNTLSNGNDVTSVFPRGTVIASNLSNTAFTMTVAGGGEEEETEIIPPGAQVAITASVIRLVFVFANVFPTDPIRALFNFDIFFPTGPI